MLCIHTLFYQRKVTKLNNNTFSVTESKFTIFLLTFKRNVLNIFFEVFPSLLSSIMISFMKTFDDIHNRTSLKFTDQNKSQIYLNIHYFYNFVLFQN